MLRQFQNRHIDVRLNQDTISVRREGDEKVLTIRNRTDGTTAEVRAEEILVAPGIRPMTELLQLEHTVSTAAAISRPMSFSKPAQMASGPWAMSMAGRHSAIKPITKPKS